jgi:hypothetical protein
MKSLTDVVIIYEAFFLYAGTAALAIVGQIPVMILGFSQRLDGHILTVISIMNNVIIFIFQICLIVIFNKLVSVACE